MAKPPVLEADENPPFALAEGKLADVDEGKPDDVVPAEGKPVLGALE